jgi:clorobiocin biosynthesis protein CloN5
VEKTDLVEDLKQFLEAEVLHEEAPDLEADTPLIELGILNSLSTAKLITFLRERHGILVPPEHIVGRHFQSLERIAELARSLHDEKPAA